MHEAHENLRLMSELLRALRDARYAPLLKFLE